MIAQKKKKIIVLLKDTGSYIYHPKAIIFPIFKKLQIPSRWIHQRHLDTHILVPYEDKSVILRISQHHFRQRKII